MKPFGNRVKAFPLFQRIQSQIKRNKNNAGDDFKSQLHRSAMMLKNQDYKQDNDDGESSGDADSDDGDEIRNYDVKDVTSGSFGTEKTQRGYKRFKELSLVCINKEKRDTEKFICVQGTFQQILLYPWWELDMNLKDGNKGSRAKVLQEPPRAQLRNDPGVDDTIVFLFLLECGVDAHHLGLLKEFARHHDRIVTFANLKDLLDKMNDTDFQNIKNAVFGAIENSEQGKLLQCKTFLKYCSALYPKDSMKIITTLSLEEMLNLDAAICNSPWELGYLVTSRKKFGLKGIEVKLKGFMESNLMQQMPKLMQDALYVYNGMKEITAKEGHTYITRQQILCPRLYSGRNCILKRKMECNDITEAISYLTEEKILETDFLLNGEEVLVFPHIKGYEVNIASCLKQLMSGSPCLPQSALKGLDFGGDDDQTKAAKMMTEKPVVVLSGPGGCGKTHVVSKLLSQVVRKCPLHSGDKTAPALKKEECTNNEQRWSASVAASLLHDLLATENAKKSDNEGTGKLACESTNLSTTDKKCSNSSSCHEDINAEGEFFEESSEKGLTHDDVRSEGQIFDDECLITAPTGRAAVIIGKRAGVKAYTMHQVIYSYVNYCRKGFESGEGDEAWRFKGTRLLICDECSLISVRLFSMLVGILRVHANLSQVVLLGDINQLPSIEPGNLLADVFYTLRQHSAAIMLRRNHRAESELIVANAKRISKQTMPVFDETKGFVPLCINSEGELGIRVSNLLETKEELLKEIGAKHGDEKTQFIAFRRKDCEIINEICCKHYNNHCTRDAKNRRDFQISDKICSTRNKEVRDLDQNLMVKITNGEIFFLRDDRVVEDGGKKQRHWVIDDLERQLKIGYQDIRKLKMKHAYARTIHTYQGSESEVIIYVVGKPWYQTCQHVYTAITRGKRQAVVLFDESSLGRAVLTPPRKRYTRLPFHIKQKLQELGAANPGESFENDETDLFGDDELFQYVNDLEPDSFFSDDNDDAFFMNIDGELLSPSKATCQRGKTPGRASGRASNTPLPFGRRLPSKRAKTRATSRLEFGHDNLHKRDLGECGDTSSDEVCAAPEPPERRMPSRKPRGKVPCKDNSSDSSPDSSNFESDVDFNGLSQKSSHRNRRKKRQTAPIVRKGPRRGSNKRKPVSNSQGITESDMLSDFDSDRDLLTDLKDSDQEFVPGGREKVNAFVSIITTRSKGKK